MKKILFLISCSIIYFTSYANNTYINFFATKVDPVESVTFQIESSTSAIGDQVTTCSVTMPNQLCFNVNFTDDSSSVATWVENTFGSINYNTTNALAASGQPTSLPGAYEFAVEGTLTVSSPVKKGGSAYLMTCSNIIFAYDTVTGWWVFSDASGNAGPNSELYLNCTINGNPIQIVPPSLMPWPSGGVGNDGSNSYWWMSPIIYNK